MFSQSILWTSHVISPQLAWKQRAATHRNLPAFPKTDLKNNSNRGFDEMTSIVQGTLLIEKANDWQKVWRRVWMKLQWKFSREKGRASVCMRVPKNGLARRAYFWILGSPFLSSCVIVFPLQASPKMGTHVAKTDALQESIFRPPTSMQFLCQMAK